MNQSYFAPQWKLVKTKDGLQLNLLLKFVNDNVLPCGFQDLVKIIAELAAPLMFVRFDYWLGTRTCSYRDYYYEDPPYSLYVSSDVCSIKKWWVNNDMRKIEQTKLSTNLIWDQYRLSPIIEDSSVQPIHFCSPRDVLEGFLYETEFDKIDGQYIMSLNEVVPSRRNRQNLIKDIQKDLGRFSGTTKSKKTVAKLIAAIGKDMFEHPPALCIITILPESSVQTITISNEQRSLIRDEFKYVPTEYCR